jgi:hypothetical protein
MLQRDGYVVHFKYIKNYYGLEYLDLVTGEVNEDFNYPFRFMITAIDNETGRLPPDLDELGEFKLYLWQYRFDVEHPDDKPSSNRTEIFTQPCTKEQKKAFDPSAADGEVLIDLNWTVCPVDGQKVPLEGRLDEFRRSTLLIEFQRCKSEECPEDVEKRMNHILFYVVFTSQQFVEHSFFEETIQPDFHIAKI